jgi:peptidyl-prolyl cis-trans isomerase C
LVFQKGKRIMLNKISLFVLVPAQLFIAGVVFAQSLPGGAVATVNGQPISAVMYEQNLRANLAQGLKDSPQLRQTVKEELINRELLAQYAEKIGLDKSPEAQLQLKQVRENLLVEMLMAAYLQQNPITEEEIRADYNRQLSLLGQTGNSMQYKISVIVVSSEFEAKDIVNRLNRGVSFAALAKEKSIDNSKANGGLVGWVLPNQVNPTLADVMVKLNKGAFAGPIATGDGWNIIKVDEKRAFLAPTLEESKNGIAQLLVQQRRAQLINQLRAEGKIIQ